MIFVILRDVDEKIRRAKVRDAGGGRAVTEETQPLGHRATLANLPAALRGMSLRDGSGEHGEPRPSRIGNTQRRGHVCG
jgi:hypothetical protein